LSASGCWKKKYACRAFRSRSLFGYCSCSSFTAM
jgi:hypothetical protein